MESGMEKKLGKKSTRKLNKILRRVFGRTKRQTYLLIPFLLITLVSFGAAITASFVLEGVPRDICLSIFSGLFGSGVYATAAEWMNKRNAKARKDEILSGLWFFCSLLFSFSDWESHFGEEHDYREWMSIFLTDRVKKKLTANELDYYLEKIVDECARFAKITIIELDNQYISKEVLADIHLLGTKSKRAKEWLNEHDCDENKLSRYLIEDIPTAIIKLFPNLKRDLSLKHSSEAEEE